MKKTTSLSAPSRSIKPKKKPIAPKRSIKPVAKPTTGKFDVTGEWTGGNTTKMSDTEYLKEARKRKPKGK